MTFNLQASIEPSKQLQLACELLNIRDCAGYRLRPALEVYKLTELPGFQPGSVVSPGEPCCRSVTSMDSFFDSTEQHTFKAWKELCIVLDKTLKQKLQVNTPPTFALCNRQYSPMHTYSHSPFFSLIRNLFCTCPQLILLCLTLLLACT